MTDIVRGRPSLLRRRLGWPFARLFEDMFEELEDEAPERAGIARRFVPAIDVSQSDREVTPSAAVPGDLIVSRRAGVPGRVGSFFLAEVCAPEALLCLLKRTDVVR